MSRLVRPPLLGMLLGLLLFPTATVPAQSPVITVQASATARRKIRLAREYLRRSDWSNAISLLNRVRTDHPDELVEVNPGQFLDTTLLVQHLLVDMPPAGLAIYRDQVDPQARRWFEAGRAAKDPAAVSRVLRDAYASRWADDALWWLGEQAWQANRPQRAARYWRQLLPPSRVPPGDDQPDTPGSPLAIQRLNFPDSQHPGAQVRARLVLCHCLAGQIERARVEWNELKQRHPDARGTLAGRTGTLVSLLSEWLARPEVWPGPAADSDHVTFAGRPERNGIRTAPVDPAAPLWHARIDNSLTAGLSRHTDRHPVVYRNLVFAADSFGLHAWTLDTGQPAWSTATGRTSLYPPPPVHPPVRATRQRTGRVSTSLTVASGRLYARIGSPVTAATGGEPRRLTHELIALDVADGQGQLVTRFDPDAISSNDTRGGWSFDGAPVVIGDRLYVCTRRGHPRCEIGVVCLDADSGEQHWHRRLASAVTAIDPSANVVTHNLLAISDGRLIYSGDTGVVARLDTASGSTAWITALDPPAGPGPFCCLPDKDSGLLLARSGRQELVALDIQNGQPAWSRQLDGGIEHLLAIQKGRAIVSGNSLWALDVHTGRIEWKRLSQEQHQFGHGRGLVASNIIYWPTRELLHVVDLKSGQPLRQPVRLDVRGCQGGNLLITQHKLVLCGNGQLTVLGRFGGSLSAPRFDNVTNPAR